MPSFFYESKLGNIILGVDEAGRGPWAGPVVAACAYIDQYKIDPEILSVIDDSKKLTPKNREKVYGSLIQNVSYGIGIASNEEIDQFNILQATFLSMERAINNFMQLNPQMKIDGILVDGSMISPKFTFPAMPLVKGDQLSFSIAAASIIAKVVRDSIMEEFEPVYPGYGFAAHKGYGTSQHVKALEVLGVSPIHRKSYAPIAKLLKKEPLHHRN